MRNARHKLNRTTKNSKQKTEKASTRKNLSAFSFIHTLSLTLTLPASLSLCDLKS